MRAFDVAADGTLSNNRVFAAMAADGVPDGRTMLLTARTSVYTMRMKPPGTQIPRAA
jgi:hypothetical protein